MSRAWLHDFANPLTRYRRPGDPANKRGDIWMNASHIVLHGRIAVDGTQAAWAMLYGWREIEQMEDGRILLERCEHERRVA